MPCGRAEVATDLDAGASSCSEKPAGSDGRRPRRLARDGFWGGGEDAPKGRIWGGGRTARGAEEPAGSDEKDGAAGGGTGGWRRTPDGTSPSSAIQESRFLRECLLGRFLFFFPCTPMMRLVLQS